MNMKSRFHYGLLVLACSAIVVSCNPGGNSSTTGNTDRIDPSVVNNPASAGGSADAEQRPEISFETTRHHFGEIIQGEHVTYAFKFTNSGNAPLLISSANATCGCTVPDFTKEPVQPGETGFINVTFNSEGKSGMESKTVSIIANTTPNTTVLTISAEIIVPEK